ncbi:MAG: NAD(P)H-dependent oxidoreductase [Candidatus Binatia bacterium]|nr:NAD(P)H-dependent oxidoreductase [Candidatus Binatia bacterium]
MKHLLIVFHSQGGGTRAMADAVLAGASEETEVETRMVDAFQGGPDDLLWANAVIFGTPENFGYMSGALKDFFDRTFYPLQGKVDQLPYAVFIKCGNDGSGALFNIDRIAKGYPLRQVAEAIVHKGDVDDAVLQKCTELGQTLAAGLAIGIF